MILCCVAVLTEVRDRIREESQEVVVRREKVGVSVQEKEEAVMAPRREDYFRLFS